MLISTRGYLMIFVLSLIALKPTTLLLLLVSWTAFAQNDEYRLVENVADQWYLWDDGRWAKHDEGRAVENTIYLQLDPGRYQNNDVLAIAAARPFSLYLNNKLLKHYTVEARLNIDSLSLLYPVPWMFGIHGRESLSWLKTTVESRDVKTPLYENPLRVHTGFKDFSIAVSILLLIFFIVLLRTNSRLTLDYFNFARLFSIQEREDNLLNSRVSSSVNILFYTFSALLAGYVLLIVFHFAARQIPIAENFVVTSVAMGFWQWLKLSFYAVLAITFRYILLAIFASLFDLRDMVSIQFFNFIRLSFFILMLSAALSLGYFVLKIQTGSNYEFILDGMVFLLVFWIIIVGLKLMRRSAFRFFHLFSYLCASEIIPVVILVKVLNS